MMRRGWLGGPKPPKNQHSLEHLKYLHHVLTKNSTVTEGNKALIVEALRSMSEILIWGDQNDSSVFEFYLEKNMFLFFLNILKQNAGNYVCVQLLQTLNILFENLQNDTSLYYLLSNNHVNEVICHKFDFSDEEVLAYYISFLKTLSFKLNQHTIHFFYNEHTDDFALYTEAIKFFNHSESMVRIAVRTLTLNVYKVQDQAMLRYIRDRTAVPYFANLVWFISNHVRELNACVRNNDNHQNLNRLHDLVAEHLDHLHYLNDILSIQNEQLNNILKEQLLRHLFVPLYIYSLTSIGDDEDIEDQEHPRINSVVALFLLSQVFLIIQYEPLVHKLAEFIFNQNSSVIDQNDPNEVYEAFRQQPESLDTWLSSKRLKKAGKKKRRPNFRNFGSDEERTSPVESPVGPVIEQNYTVEEVEGSNDSPEASSPRYSDDDMDSSSSPNSSSAPDTPGHATTSLPPSLNYTDEQKAAAARFSSSSAVSTSRPFLDTIYSALNCKDNDYNALLALCLLYAMLHNKGISADLTEVVTLGQAENDDEEENNDTYSHWLVERLLRILSTSVKTVTKVRLATLGLSCLLLKEIGIKKGRCILLESHVACIEDSRTESMENLHRFYKEEEMFLDIFEDEYRTFQDKPLNVEYLMMDSSLLLPPTGTPLTGIEFSNRLPCGPAEQAKRAIGTFIALRDLSLALCKEVETQLPLTRQQDCIQNNEKLDLNNSDLIGCLVSSRDGRQRRFLVVELYQLLLVEPDSKRLGWAVVRFAGFLQDVEVASDNEDSRVLKVTIHKPSGARRVPLLSADFIFDDHIRCMAAKQRLTKGRLRARSLKMQRIAVLLGLPENTREDPFANSYMLNTSFHAPRNQFRAYAEPHAVEIGPHQRATSYTPQPILKRPGGSIAITPGRIGSLGLPVSPRAGSDRNQSPVLGNRKTKPPTTLSTRGSAPELISAKDLTLALQNNSTGGIPTHHSEPPSLQDGTPQKGHRRNNSAHISSSELPYEELGVQVGNIELDPKSGGSNSQSTELDDASPLEEGVDASSLNEFSVDDDATYHTPIFGIVQTDVVSITPNPSAPSSVNETIGGDQAIGATVNEDVSSFSITNLETDDLKAARMRSESSTSNKDVAPALQPPSSAPATLMNQEEPRFSVSLSPIKSPTLCQYPPPEQ